METEGEIEELSSRINNCPRDLLRRFAGDGGGDERSEVAGGGMCEIELSLGLSLGGCFGMEPKDNRLVRSSSIATLSVFPVDHADFPAVTVPMTRTCSLPAETDEEKRKRKEMQSFKRLEAKRKRSEKRAAAAAKDRKEENLDEDLGGMNKDNISGQFVGNVNGAVLPAERPRGAVGAGRGATGARLASQGSIGSQGSSSSGVSDFESKPMQGLDVSGLGNCAEVRSPSTMPPESDHTNHKASTAPPKQVVGNPANANLSREGDEPSRKRRCTAGRVNGVKEMEREMMEEMPCVSTKGDGPNGRRIEGFLYKYRKRGEVRIVCVCHGSFLTPAEFVKHAGGGDVAHPLRHIVVNPTPSPFL